MFELFSPGLERIGNTYLVEYKELGILVGNYGGTQSVGMTNFADAVVVLSFVVMDSAEPFEYDEEPLFLAMVERLENDKMMPTYYHTHFHL